MAEEAVVIETGDIPHASEEVVLTEVEQEMHAKGWRPEAEYEGDNWIPAQEFKDRAPLFEGLSKANKKIKRMEKVLHDFSEHNKKIEQSAYEQAKADLKEKRVEAMRNEEYGQAVDLEDEARNLEAPAEVQPASEVFVDWSEDNEWYSMDRASLPDAERRASMYADTFGRQYGEDHPNAPQGEILEAVTKEVKVAFPAIFSKPLPNRGNASGAQGGQRGGGDKYHMMTATQQKMCRELTQSGAITQDKYIADLEKMGDLGKD